MDKAQELAAFAAIVTEAKNTSQQIKSIVVEYRPVAIPGRRAGVARYELKPFVEILYFENKG